MRLLKFVERFFPKVFIGIWLNRGRYHISVRKTLPSGSTKSETFSFDADAELEVMSNKLNKIQKDNILSYISLLDSSTVFGAVPTVKRHQFIEYDEVNSSPDFDDILFHPQKEKWTIFSSKSELLHLQNRFQDSGLDFIFSPFLLPNIAKQRFNLSQSTSIFIVAEKDLSLFTIFKAGNLLYGRVIDEIDSNEEIINISQKEIEDNDMFEFDELTPDIESNERYKNQSDSSYFDEGELDFDLSDMDDLNQEEDFLDLDLLDDKFEDDSVDEPVDERLIQKKEKSNNSISELEKFLEEDMVEEDMAEAEIIQNTEVDYDLIYSAIKRGVHNFYNDKLYPSDFIENCYILTELKVNSSFIQKIEDEFSFDTEKVRVDISELLVDLTGEEVAKN